MLKKILIWRVYSLEPTNQPDDYEMSRDHKTFDLEQIRTTIKK